MEQTTDELLNRIHSDITLRGTNVAPIPLAISHQRNDETGQWEWLVYLDVHIPRGRYLSIEQAAPTLIDALATVARRLRREYPHYASP